MATTEGDWKVSLVGATKFRCFAFSKRFLNLVPVLVPNQTAARTLSWNTGPIAILHIGELRRLGERFEPLRISLTLSQWNTR